MKVISKNQTAKGGKKSGKGTSGKSGKKKSPQSGGFIQFLGSPKMIKVYGILLMLFALVSFVSIFSYLFTHKADEAYLSSGGVTPAGNWCGGLGAHIAHLCADYTFGLFTVGLSFLAFLYGVRITFEKSLLPLRKTTVTTLLTIAWLSMLLATFVVPREAGLPKPDDFPAGAFGNLITGFLVLHTGLLVTILILLALLFAILLICYNLSTDTVIEAASKLKPQFHWKRSGSDTRRRRKDGNGTPDDEGDTYMPADLEPLPDLYISSKGEIDGTRGSNTVVFESEKKTADPQPADSPVDFSIVNPTETVSPDENDEEVIEDDGELPAETALVPLEDYDPRKDLSFFKFPTTDLLLDYDSVVVDDADKMKDLREKKERIEQTLKSFGIAIKKIYATIGPTVTLYEIVPMEGVRISKIKNLEDDIALSLAALGIRIIAPIPGKGTIGIEVPNAKPQIVPMKDILNSEKFQNCKYELPIGLGKTISDEPFVADLAKMPHLLMAGATGQGKSVGLNAIIASLLYKKHPAELKFVLVDPKKLEFSLYSIIENHYLAELPGSDEPIITDTKKVIYTLNSLCAEMDARYDLMKVAGVRNIKEYNAKFCKRLLSPANGHRYLPYIVLVIDEFGDLIMTAGREVETPIARLAQLARACGIHLIIATQRPSVNIITGMIKANFPSRIAFRVTAAVDSRTILDCGGANQLIGKGDMLLSTGSDLVRLQCAFIDTPEVEALTRYIAEQQGYPEPFLLPEYVDDSAKDNFDDPIDSDSIDPCFMDAATLVVETQQGSTSLIQRKMRLGYARAGRVMDQLEEFKIVGPSMGSKVREVKVKTTEELRVIFQNMGLI
ncbi:MAG: DNA translocase FtsK 4TM domain-containing protein [Bacteroidales bacterium]|nr:DNA translocase FtsK 4TM domain-containing protein [Bacteroidales bacterium]